MTIGEEIKNRRRKKGLSQETLARLVNVSRQTVYKWEYGYIQPTAENIAALNDVLGCDLSVYEVGFAPSQPSGASEDFAVISERNDNDFLMNIGERIRNGRRKKGLSQETLAQLANVSRQTVYKWEYGYIQPTNENIAVLNDVLGCDLFVGNVGAALSGSGAAGAFSAKKAQTEKSVTRNYLVISIVLAALAVLSCVMTFFVGLVLFGNGDPAIKLGASEMIPFYFCLIVSISLFAAALIFVALFSIKSNER